MRWTHDRYHAEKAFLGEVIMAGHAFTRTVSDARARLLPVIPLTARDGGVKLLVWLPKAAPR